MQETVPISVTTRYVIVWQPKPDKKIFCLFTKTSPLQPEMTQLNSNYSKRKQMLVTVPNVNAVVATFDPDQKFSNELFFELW